MTDSPVAADEDGVVGGLVGFARTLRHAGVEAGPDRLQAMIAAVGELDVLAPRDVYWAGRITLCGCLDDLERYDAAFAAYFGDEPPGSPGHPHTASAMPVRRFELPLGGPDADRGSEDSDDDDVRQLPGLASGEEVLRTRDIAELDAEERETLRRLYARLVPRPPRRPSRRHVPAHRGSVDVGRTVRATLRTGGELTRLARRRRRVRPRRVVLLIDVSGSMAPYADALLRLAHVTVRRSPASTEVFTIGTRLTRVTRELRQRDPERAITAAGQAIPDWSGGTRLGEALKAFLDRWGQRGVARRAVVVVFSDGWERGEPTLLAEQMARLHRLAQTVVWANPHKGQANYQPLTGGMSAALPHIDRFVAGHSFAAFEELVEVIADA